MQAKLFFMIEELEELDGPEGEGRIAALLRPDSKKRVHAPNSRGLLAADASGEEPEIEE